MNLFLLQLDEYGCINIEFFLTMWATIRFLREKYLFVDIIRITCVDL